MDLLIRLVAGGALVMLGLLIFGLAVVQSAQALSDSPLERKR